MSLFSGFVPLRFIYSELFFRLLDSFRSVYCKEHYAEVVGGGGSKRKKAAGKGKGKGSTGSKACDHVGIFCVFCRCVWSLERDAELVSAGPCRMARKYSCYCNRVDFYSRPSTNVRSGSVSSALDALASPYVPPSKFKQTTPRRPLLQVVLDDLDLLPSLGDDLKSTGAAVEVFNPYSSAASSSSSNTAAPSGAGAGAGSGGGTGKIKASWYRRLLGEALLAVELDRVEATRGVGVSGGLTAPWRKEFVKNATCVSEGSRGERRGREETGREEGGCVV